MEIMKYLMSSIYLTLNVSAVKLNILEKSSLRQIFTFWWPCSITRSLNWTKSFPKFCQFVATKRKSFPCFSEFMVMRFMCGAPPLSREQTADQITFDPKDLHTWSCFPIRNTSQTSQFLQTCKYKKQLVKRTFFKIVEPAGSVNKPFQMFVFGTFWEPI